MPKKKVVPTQKGRKRKRQHQKDSVSDTEDKKEAQSVEVDKVAEPKRKTCLLQSIFTVQFVFVFPNFFTAPLVKPEKVSTGKETVPRKSEVSIVEENKTATDYPPGSPLLFETPQSERKEEKLNTISVSVLKSKTSSSQSSERSSSQKTLTPPSSMDATFVKEPVLDNDAVASADRQAKNTDGACSSSSKPLLNTSYVIEKKSNETAENGPVIAGNGKTDSSDSDEFSSLIMEPEDANTVASSKDKNATFVSKTSSDADKDSDSGSVKSLENKGGSTFVVPGIKNASSNRVEKMQEKISGLIEKGVTAPTPKTGSHAIKGKPVAFGSTLKDKGVVSSVKEKTSTYTAPKLKTMAHSSTVKEKVVTLNSAKDKKAITGIVPKEKVVVTGSIVKDKIKAINSAAKDKVAPAVILPSKIKPIILSSTSTMKTNPVSVVPPSSSKEKSSPKKEPASSYFPGRLLDSVKDNIFGHAKAKLFGPPKDNLKGPASNLEKSTDIFKNTTTGQQQSTGHSKLKENDHHGPLNVTYNANKYQHVSNHPRRYVHMLSFCPSPLS